MRPRRALLVAALAALPALPAVAQGDPSFSLLNRSGQAINEIYVSPVSEPNWGRDLLGSANQQVHLLTDRYTAADFAEWHIQFVYQANYINSTRYRTLDNSDVSRLRRSHAHGWADGIGGLVLTLGVASAIFFRRAADASRRL